MLTAIIGGSGLAELEGLTITHREVMRTEYGEPSGPLTFGKMSGRDIVFMNRHGPGKPTPPTARVTAGDRSLVAGLAGSFHGLSSKSPS